MAFFLVLGLSACGGGEDGAETSKEEKVYAIGDTWTVDGQWELTIDSVEATDERNEFDETNPKQVIRIGYNYKNLGYEDESGIMDGLYIDLDSSGQLIDADGNVCSGYPLGDVYAEETPVGAKCVAESYFGLKESGSPVKLTLTVYDGSGNKHKATYELSF